MDFGRFSEISKHFGRLIGFWERRNRGAASIHLLVVAKNHFRELGYWKPGAKRAPERSQERL